METKILHQTDYVIYNAVKNYLIRFSSDKDIVIYGTKQEAIEDCDKSNGEHVVCCTDLPKDLRLMLLNQINRKNLT